MPEPNAASAQNDPILDRLEDQIRWYDSKSLSAQDIFKRIKVVEILAAALIPFFSGLNFQYVKLLVGGLGVLITILEGLLHLNQYQQSWTTYRSTCEALKREKFEYLALAGSYAAATNPRALLAERVESTVAREHALWTAAQQSGKAQGSVK